MSRGPMVLLTRQNLAAIHALGCDLGVVVEPHYVRDEGGLLEEVAVRVSEVGGPRLWEVRGGTTTRLEEAAK